MSTINQKTGSWSGRWIVGALLHGVAIGFVLGVGIIAVLHALISYAPL
jgi:hypothetical protein